MNLQEYISSGIIESYVLGFASEKEKQEFERMLKKHPELVQLRDQFEVSLEKEAFANAIQPPAHLKETILSRINEESKSNAKVVTIYPPKVKRRISGKTWAVAASIILAIGCGFMVYTFYMTNRKLKGEIAQSKENIEKLEHNNKLVREAIVPPDLIVKPAKIDAPTQEIPPLFEVFWDSTNTDVYVIIKNLKALPVGQRYELWSLSKDKKESMGLFDAPQKEDKLILKVDDVQQAESFAITIYNPNPQQ